MSSGSKRVKTEFDDLTYKIIGCAMAIHRELGSGLREDSYQRDLEIQLSKEKIAYDSQRYYEVKTLEDKEGFFGYNIPDFVVEDTIIVEINALNRLDNSHIAQVIGYLAVTELPIGLLINFGERSLRFKRILPPKNITDHQVNRQWLFVPEWMKEDNKS